MTVTFDRSVLAKQQQNFTDNGNDWISAEWDVAVRMRALNKEGVYHYFLHQSSGNVRFGEQEFVKDEHHIRNIRHTVTDGGGQMTKYQVIVSKDEDGMFFVQCPAIPGCVSEGETIDEALDNIKDAIRGCLEVMAEYGLSPDVTVYDVEV